jgi:hypothetical protein
MVNAGALMSGDYVTMGMDKKVGEALTELRRPGRNKNSISYVYVVEGSRTFAEYSRHEPCGRRQSDRWRDLDQRVMRSHEQRRNVPISSRPSGRDYEFATPARIRATKLARSDALLVARVLY